MIMTTTQLEVHLNDRLAYFCKMFGENRVDELVKNFYTDDAVIEGPGLPVQRGHAAIQAIFGEARKAYKGIEITMDPLVHPDQTLAYGFITNRNIRNDDVIEIHRAHIVWRKVDDNWLCQTDFFFIP